MTRRITSLLAILMLLASSAFPAANGIPQVQPGQTIVALAAVTATGAGSASQVQYLPVEASPASKFTYTAIVTGAPAATNINLEGATDLRQVLDGVCTATSTSFTSATAAFTAADVGKAIYLPKCGTAGAIQTNSISSVSNATTIVLGTAAVTSATNVSAYYAMFYVLDSSTTTTNEMRHVVNKPVFLIRANLTTLTGGASPTVTVTITPGSN